MLSLYLGVALLALVTVPAALIIDKAVEHDGWQRSVTGFASFVSVILVTAAIYSGIRESFSENTIWAVSQVAATALLIYVGLRWFNHSNKRGGI